MSPNPSSGSTASHSQGAGCPAPAPKNRKTKTFCYTCLLLALRASDDLIRNHAWSFFVASKLHGVGRAALCRRANVVHVAKHLLERHNRLDQLRTGSMLETFDTAAAGVDVADDGANELFRHSNFDSH